jgi:hypothetical protein
LRRRAASGVLYQNNVYFEQLKPLLIGLTLIVPGLLLSGWLSLILVSAGAIIAMTGMAFVWWQFMHIAIDANEKRYGIFTKKRLSREYREGDR